MSAGRDDRLEQETERERGHPVRRVKRGMLVQGRTDSCDEVRHAQYALDAFCSWAAWVLACAPRVPWRAPTCAVQGQDPYKRRKVRQERVSTARRLSRSTTRRKLVVRRRIRAMVEDIKSMAEQTRKTYRRMARTRRWLEGVAALGVCASYAS